jgi:hypothetical protein
MADIGIANCSILERGVAGEIQQVEVLTPATADSADTVDLTTVLAGKAIGFARCWDVTAGDAVTITVNTSTKVATLDAAGGTTDHQYRILLELL